MVDLITADSEFLVQSPISKDFQTQYAGMLVLGASWRFDFGGVRTSVKDSVSIDPPDTKIS